MLDQPKEIASLDATRERLKRALSRLENAVESQLRRAEVRSQASQHGTSQLLDEARARLERLVGDCEALKEEKRLLLQALDQSERDKADLLERQQNVTEIIAESIETLDEWIAGKA